MPAKRLIELFKETGAFKTGKFTLSSGIKESPYYIDCKQISLHPEAINLICGGFENFLDDWSRGKKVIDAVGGLVIGPDPIIGALVQRSWYRGENQRLYGFMVRKEPKEHGTNQYIEGSLQNNHHTVLIEDVCTTGKSLIEAAHRVWKYGCSVAFAMTVVDRQEGATEALNKHKIPLYNILHLKDLL
jgi:orotate phosphoribosyltransferase